MPESTFQRFYPRADFVALVGSLEENRSRIQTALGDLTLTLPINNVALNAYATAIVVTWEAYPPEADLDAIDAAVAAFVGGETTSQPFVYQSFATSTTTSGTHQTKIDETTPPLDAGTYQVSWVCSTKMAAVIANTGVEAKIRLERSDGAFVEQDDAWDRANRHAYNGSQPFPIAAGQTIRAHLTFARLGASGTAEISGARVTIDKID